MAVQPFLYLALSDGTTTLVMSDGANGATNYPPTAWAPAIAGQAQVLLAGRGPYANVVEDIRVDVIGTTAADCYAKLDVLIRLLDQADRWWLRAENVAAVVLKYAPQGSTIASTAAPMSAIVIGRATGDASAARLPATFDSAGNQFKIMGVGIKIIRRGQWIGASEATATSGGAANATVLNRSFSPSHPINSPVDVVIGGFNGTSTPIIQPGFLMIGSNATDITVYEGETMSGGVYSSVADATNLARGGAVLRYTPAGTAIVASPSQSLGTVLNGMAAIYAAVRNNSGTTIFQIQAVISGFSGVTVTPPTLIDTSSVQPRLAFLGTVNVAGASGLQVQIQASAASGSLDIDYIVVVNLRNETVVVIAHDAIDCSGVSSGACTLQAVYSPVTDRDPVLKAVAVSGGGVRYGAYRGALPLLTTADTIYALWMATNGQYWRFTNTSNAVVNITLAATRYRGYLSPQ